ncbi:MAG: ZIP family metal transporter [Candidatus Chaera renei]|uniref:ZIP family metal transporter n=1 Tax=Candidatus Chaera renei TaxID=2506947 RepID=A0A4Q0AKK2_9BACT|nr:MAG: ZIP family metal transporter [Candidatus Chaera renei]
MSLVSLVFAVTLAGSLVSLIGGLYLITGGRLAGVLKGYSVPFAAGALLAAAFGDLLPEAVSLLGGWAGSLWAMFGMILFFVLERTLRWFHHHHVHEAEPVNANRSLIVTGDILHNALDGVAIGAAFLVSPAAGIVTTVAVAAHEIPHEIGNFGLLLSKGMKRLRVVAVNVAGALATAVAATATAAAGGWIEPAVAPLLAVSAGFFVYIAASDVIPSIHAETNWRRANLQSGVLVGGNLLLTLFGWWLGQTLGK